MFAKLICPGIAFWEHFRGWDILWEAATHWKSYEITKGQVLSTTFNRLGNQGTGVPVCLGQFLLTMMGVDSSAFTYLLFFSSEPICYRTLMKKDPLKNLPRRNCMALLLFWLLALVGARRTLWVSECAFEMLLLLVGLVLPLLCLLTFTTCWNLSVYRTLT